MDDTALRTTIETAWEARTTVSSATQGVQRDAVAAALAGLDDGRLRVAEPGPDGWTTHEWLKKAVLLSFRLSDSAVMAGNAWDKVPLKTAGWGENRFRAAGFRLVSGAVVRHSAFIAPGVVVMPSFVNVGAHIGADTMIDTWATVGSCAQVGARCHISGGAGLGGVLEPLQASPVVVEDDCFIGARSEVVEGVRIGRGSVLSMGVFIGAATRIVDRATGTIHYGHVPPYSVIVPGAMPGSDGGISLYCAVIVKRVDAQTRSKTSINDLLRD